MKGLIIRLILIGTVFLLFIIESIELALLIDTSILGILILILFKIKKIPYEVVGFFTAFGLMYISKILYPDFFVLSRTPHYIYSSLFIITLISIFIRKPFSTGILIGETSKYGSPFEFRKSYLWLMVFLSSALFAFLLFPGKYYIILSGLTVLAGAIINVVLNFLWKSRDENKNLVKE